MIVYRIDTNDRLRHLILEDYDFQLKTPKCYRKSYLQSIKDCILYQNNTFGDKSRNGIHFYRFALDAFHLKKQNMNNNTELNFCIYDVPNELLEYGYGNYFPFGIKPEYVANKNDINASMIKKIFVSEQKINHIIYDELDEYIKYYSTAGKAIETALSYKEEKIDDRFNFNHLPRETGVLKHCEHYLYNIFASIYKSGYFNDKKYFELLSKLNEIIINYYKQLDFLIYNEDSTFSVSSEDNPVKQLSTKVLEIPSQEITKEFIALEKYYNKKVNENFSFKFYKEEQEKLNEKEK